MWFVEFMQQALYHPLHGYYTRPHSPIGRAGDFITAPELSPLFAQTLARLAQEICASLSVPKIFEFGAGNGRLCSDLLQALEKVQCLPDQYMILEVSQSLQQTQYETLAREMPHYLNKIQWIHEWPTQAFEGLVIANEVLDAMPVHRFKYENHDVYESKITRTPEGKWQETWEPTPYERVAQHVQSRMQQVTGPYISEYNGLMDDWMEHCSAMLQRGMMLVIDYGFPAHEYYHPDRSMGTLICHHQHHAHTDFFAHIGNEDITAHVDFTHVAEAASQAGFEVAWFASQASFLLDHGLLDVFQTIQDEKQRWIAQQHIHQLLSPSEMGELFKVMALTKNMVGSSAWNWRHDRRASL